MAASKLYNLARMLTATTGTGTITLGAAVPGFLTFAQAGAANGETITYAIEDGTSREIGRGVYTTSGTTLTRSVLKATPSGGTTPITLSGTAQVFITPAAEDIAAGVVRVQVFTASGTYTPHADMVTAIVEAQGGGGAGGAATGTTGHTFIGAGGGAGAYARKLLTAATVGASQVVTVGAAGAGGSAAGGAGSASSLGSLCVASGGAGGSRAASSALPQSVSGGLTGTGDLVIAGGNGAAGKFVVATSNASPAGMGGSSFFSRGGISQIPWSDGAVTGAVATGYGGGGGGAGTEGTNTTNPSGGSGSQGVVIVWEFCRS